MRTILTAILFILGAVTAGLAQNNELGLLIGPSLFQGQTSAGKTTYVRFSGQIDYAVQVHEEGSSRLYLELPVVIAGTVVRIPLGSRVGTQIGGRLFLTPGIRWKWMPSSRWSVYAAAGAGICWSGVVKGTIDVAFGGDFRVTRLLSLRAEARNFITPAPPAYTGILYGEAMFGGVIHF
jgi:hypothetical protein